MTSLENEAVRRGHALHRAVVPLVMLALAAACQTQDRPKNLVSNGDPSSNERTSDPARPGTGGKQPSASGGSSSGSGGVSPEGPATVVTAETLAVGGKARSFVLAVPTAYSGDRTYPLVLVLHGDEGDGASIRAAFPFDEISREDAIVAYPSGYKTWNLYDPTSSNEDFAFLVSLVDALKGRFSIDTARVFGMGFSSGAFMINQVSCRNPSLFRAIAPHSGGAPNEPRDPSASHWSNDLTRCAGQTLGNGPAALVIHGTSDGVVTFDSGEFTATYWAYIDGCAGTRNTAFAPSPCVAHDSCPSGKPVALCAIPGLGHTVWSGAGTAAWDFFRGF